MDEKIKELFESWINGNKKTVIEELYELDRSDLMYYCARLQQEIGNDFVNYLEKYIQ